MTCVSDRPTPALRPAGVRPRRRSDGAAVARMPACRGSLHALRGRPVPGWDGGEKGAPSGRAAGSACWPANPVGAPSLPRRALPPANDFRHRTVAGRPHRARCAPNRAARAAARFLRMPTRRAGLAVYQEPDAGRRAVFLDFCGVGLELIEPPAGPERAPNHHRRPGCAQIAFALASPTPSTGSPTVSPQLAERAGDQPGVRVSVGAVVSAGAAREPCRLAGGPRDAGG